MFTKVLRKNSRIITLSLALSISVGGYARNNVMINNIEDSSVSTIELSSMNGKELFQGILFYSGKAADLIPIASQQKKIMSQLDAKIQKDFHNLQLQIIDVLEAKNPNYFNEFREDIISKNHYKIQQRVKIASDDIKEVAAKLFSIDISANTSIDNIANKMLANSRYSDIKNPDGSISIERLNKIYTDSKKSEDPIDLQPDACLAIVLVVAVVLIYVYEHNRADIITGNNLMLKSNFETETYVNQIVKLLK